MRKQSVDWHKCFRKKGRGKNASIQIIITTNKDSNRIDAILFPPLKNQNQHSNVISWTLFRVTQITLIIIIFGLLNRTQRYFLHLFVGKCKVLDWNIDWRAWLHCFNILPMVEVTLEKSDAIRCVLWAFELWNPSGGDTWWCLSRCSVQCAFVYNVRTFCSIFDALRCWRISEIWSNSITDFHDVTTAAVYCKV